MDWNAAAVVGLIGVGSGVASSFLGHLISRAREEGRFGAMLMAQGKDIESLKASRSEIWDVLNEHGERISKVEVVCQERHHNADHPRLHSHPAHSHP